MITTYRLAHEIALAKSPDPFKPAPTENRWNSVGVQVAYTSEHLALAALELLTYWGHYPNLRGYQLFTITFSPEDVEDALGRQPNLNVQAGRQTRHYGDAWVQEGRSLALRVPSVVVPLSFNYLINPNHPHYDSKAVTAYGAFVYDERIGKLVEQAKSMR